jgi:hypothetical protein
MSVPPSRLGGLRSAGAAATAGAGAGSAAGTRSRVAPQGGAGVVAQQRSTRSGGSLTSAAAKPVRAKPEEKATSAVQARTLGKRKREDEAAGGAAGSPAKRARTEKTEAGKTEAETAAAAHGKNARRLSSAVVRPKQWDADLGGKAIARKDGDVPLDVRHVISYETMQKAFKSVIEKTGDEDALDDLMAKLATTLERHGKDGSEAPSSVVGNVNKALFNCRGNFFTGEARTNQRAGSTTAALARTLEKRSDLVFAAKTLPEVEAVVVQVVGSFSNPIFTSLANAFGVHAGAGAGAGEIPSNKETIAQVAAAIVKSVSAHGKLKGPDLSDTGDSDVHEFKMAVINAFESFVDSTGADVSQARDTDLAREQRDLTKIMELFRGAEQSGRPEVFLRAVENMLALEDRVVALAKSKDMTLEELYKAT